VKHGDAFLNEFTDVVEFYPNVFHIGMVYVVFSQASGSIVVTEDGYEGTGTETEARQEFAEEGKFMRRIVEGDVLSIA
jgi:hypothetical protein